MKSDEPLDIDQFSTYLKKKFVLKNYMFISIILLTFTLFFYFFGKLLMHAQLCFVFFCAFSIIYLFAKRGKISFVNLVHFQNFFLMSVITFAFLISGGLRAPAIFWIPIVSYTTMSLIGRRSMFIWLGIGLTIATTFLVLDLNGVEFKNLQGELNRHILHYVHLVLLALYTISISILNEKTNREYAKNQMKLIEGMYHQNRLMSMGEIVAGVSHEINNPLAIAHGSVFRLKKLLSKEDITNPEVLETIESVEIANERIMDIVKSLKTFYRKENASEGITNLKRLMDETVRLIKNEYSGDNIKIILSEVPSSLNIIGNHTQIQQVLFNLLSNARDALEEIKEKVIEINIDDQNKNKVIISVKDNGQGIPEEISDKVLNPFFTTKDVNKGTGLGLSIIHNIVKSINGSIEIESTEGAGTTVKVVLERA
jgi:signal transduction histidine kinase